MFGYGNGDIRRSVERCHILRHYSIMFGAYRRYLFSVFGGELCLCFITAGHGFDKRFTEPRPFFQSLFILPDPQPPAHADNFVDLILPCSKRIQRGACAGATSDQGDLVS